MICGCTQNVNRVLKSAIRGFINLFYIENVAKYISAVTFRYLACGVMNYFVIDPLLYAFIYNYIVGHENYDFGFVIVSPHILAMILLFPITLFLGFWLNRNVAFEATQERVKPQMIKYLISIGGSLVISYLLMKFFVDIIGIWPTPSKVLSSITTAIYSYLAARYFTFRKR